MQGPKLTPILIAVAVLLLGLMVFLLMRGAGERPVEGVDAAPATTAAPARVTTGEPLHDTPAPAAPDPEARDDVTPEQPAPG